MRTAAWSPAGADGRYSYETAVVVPFWPEPQHRALIGRWPHLADRMGATWDEHRRRIERYCALAERDTRMAVNQVSVDLGGFEAFLARRGVTTPTGDDLNAYPDVRHATARFSAWPPDRTAACWCGSGRKYKQCCRPYGLGILEPDDT